MHNNTDYSPSSTRCISTFKADPTLTPVKMPSTSSHKTTDHRPSSARCISTLKSTENHHSNTTEMARLSTCAIQDSKPTTSNSSSGGGNQDFDFLFNEDVLSDSPEVQDDLIF